MRYGTYVITRPFAGFNIPVPFQNLILRDHFKSINSPYPLPEVEHKFDNCYMSLFTLIDKLPLNAVIAMVSLEILPTSIKYNEIAKKCLTKKIAIYGVLEKKMLSEKNEFLDYIRIRRFADDCND